DAAAPERLPEEVAPREQHVARLQLAAARAGVRRRFVTFVIIKESVEAPTAAALAGRTLRLVADHGRERRRVVRAQELVEGAWRLLPLARRRRAPALVHGLG